MSEWDKYSNGYDPSDVSIRGTSKTYSSADITYYQTGTYGAVGQKYEGSFIGYKQEYPYKEDSDFVLKNQISALIAESKLKQVIMDKLYQDNKFLIAKNQKLINRNFQMESLVSDLLEFAKKFIEKNKHVKYLIDKIENLLLDEKERSE